MTDPDSAEIDAIKELEQSAGWELVTERIREELERARNDLEQGFGMEKTYFARGYVKALRTALAIPEILKQEIGARDVH